MTPRKQTKSGNQRNAEYRDRQQAKDKEGFLKKHAEANRKSRAKKKQEIEELRQRAEQPLAMAAVQAYELLLKDKAKEQKAVLASSGKTEKRAFNANQQIVKSGSDFRNRSLKTFAKMIGCSVSTAGAAVIPVVVKLHPTERHGNGVLAANLKDERNYSALVDSDNVPSCKTPLDIVRKLEKRHLSWTNWTLVTTTNFRTQMTMHLLKRLNATVMAVLFYKVPAASIVASSFSETSGTGTVMFRVSIVTGSLVLSFVSL